MYKIELVTEDQDLLIKEFYSNDWIDILEKIKDIKKLNLHNIKIDIFKKSDADLVYLGNFNTVRTDAAIEKTELPKIQVNSKYIKILISIVLLILFFPVMVLIEMTKSKDA